MVERRNLCIQEFDIPGSVPGSTRATCARLGHRSFQVVVSGDDNKQVLLWKISKPTALLSFQGHSSDVTAVQFAYHEQEVYSGSYGGTVIVWDINAQKAQCSLKGHMAKCTTIASFPASSQTYLATGSEDCNIKLWDLRRKACIQTFKGHRGPVTCAQFSPDNRWIASGGTDGVVKIWDLNSARKFADFSLGDSPCTCLQFNPCNLSLAVGHQDRTVKYWDLEANTHISTTSPDPTAISQICFEPEEGRHLFSASNNSLKVWDIEGSVMMDNIESTWSGVTDLAVSQAEGILVGLCFNNQSFNVWTTDLQTVNFTDEYNRPSYEPPAVPAAPAQQPAAQSSNWGQQSFIPQRRDQPSNINMQEFVPKQPPARQNSGSFSVVKVLEEANKGHEDLISIMRSRYDNVTRVVNPWQQGNINQMISQLGMTNDTSTIKDVMNFCFIDNRIDNVKIEHCALLCPHFLTLINSKYEAYVKTGLQSASYLLKNFQDVIIQTLTAAVMGGVDLSREERIAKCEGALNGFRALLDSEKLSKHSERQNDVGNLAKELKKSLDQLIWGCQRRG